MRRRGIHRGQEDRPLIVRCPTGKTGFKRHEAERRLEAATGRKVEAQRIYECPHCGHWHLTSKPV